MNRLLVLGGSDPVANADGQLLNPFASAAAGERGGRQRRAYYSGAIALTGRSTWVTGEKLHDLRQEAHDVGIEGNSKMTEEQLREALRKVGKGKRPQMAKPEAKR